MNFKAVLQPREKEGGRCEHVRRGMFFLFLVTVSCEDGRDSGRVFRGK